MVIVNKSIDKVLIMILKVKLKINIKITEEKRTLPIDFGNKLSKIYLIFVLRVLIFQIFCKIVKN